MDTNGKDIEQEKRERLEWPRKNAKIAKIWRPDYADFEHGNRTEGSGS
jgi:hypothetical protein